MISIKEHTLVNNKKKQIFLTKIIFLTVLDVILYYNDKPDFISNFSTSQHNLKIVFLTF